MLDVSLVLALDHALSIFDTVLGKVHSPAGRVDLLLHLVLHRLLKGSVFDVDVRVSHLRVKVEYPHSWLLGLVALGSALSSGVLH